MQGHDRREGARDPERGGQEGCSPRPSTSWPRRARHGAKDHLAGEDSECDKLEVDIGGDEKSRRKLGWPLALLVYAAVAWPEPGRALSGWGTRPKAPLVYAAVPRPSLSHAAAAARAPGELREAEGNLKRQHGFHEDAKDRLAAEEGEYDKLEGNIGKHEGVGPWRRWRMLRLPDPSPDEGVPRAAAAPCD